MHAVLRFAFVLVVVGLWTGVAAAQPPAGETPASETPSDESRLPQSIDEVEAKVEGFARDVNQDPRAKDAAAGILKPIYQLAEFLSRPWIHWVAFAIMVAGVVSFALQLVLAKLVVLMKFSISFTEILSDALGLVISLVGLVLTTQAATENSTFTSSPFAVLSAALVGLLVGFVFYWWGQRAEIQAVDGRRVTGDRKVVPPR